MSLPRLVSKHLDLAALRLLLFIRHSGFFCRRHALHSRNQAPKQKMLHDRQLVQNLLDKHLAHTALDLRPVLGRRYIVQHRTVPAQTLDVLDTIDKRDLVEVHVIRPLFFEHELVVDALGRDVRVVQELGRAEEEGEELVVVQAPDAVRARGLEIVCALDLAHEAQVRGQDDEGERGEGRGWEEREAV